MIVRAAVESDLSRVLKLGKAFFDQAGWPQISSWHPPSIEQFLRSLMFGPADGGLLVAEHGGAVVGMFGYLCFPFYFNFNEIAAQELFWYAEDQHRFGAGAAMHDHFEDVARQRGVNVVIMSAVSGLRDKALARLYRRRGYQSGEMNFLKRIK